MPSDKQLGKRLPDAPDHAIGIESKPGSKKLLMTVLDKVIWQSHTLNFHVRQSRTLNQLQDCAAKASSEDVLFHGYQPLGLSRQSQDKVCGQGLGKANVGNRAANVFFSQPFCLAKDWPLAMNLPC